MTDLTDKAADTIQFSERHRPQLEAGDYTITVEPLVVKNDGTNLLNATLNSKLRIEQRFFVAGSRFTLDPQQVEAVFPPAGSVGEHSSVLPHIVLRRSTLPWERSANGEKEMPWLALLLFDEHDFTNTPGLLEQIRQPRSEKLGRLLDHAPKESFGAGVRRSVGDGKTAEYTTCFPRFRKGVEAPLALESGDHIDDAVVVIDVPRTLLATIAPSPEELKLLAHVRHCTDGDGAERGEKRAVVICNRLPAKGGTSVVHLVSVEDRYTSSTIGSHAGAECVRLVSLYSWRFACVSETHSFRELLKKLDTGVFRLPELTGASPSVKMDADCHLERGCVPVPHTVRNGEKSVSWYHGPLVPGRAEYDVELPVRSADDLMLYHQNLGMFDVSYSAAWQLGRLLTLQNRRVAVELFNWKRSHAQALSINEVREKLAHLPFAPPAVADFPESVRAWFVELALLRCVPFNYIVPDERMLPPESIRFFQIDPSWVECLRDGAFSIGRVFATDHERDVKLHADHIARSAQTISGFLLRSDVVAGWPGLLVDGYAHPAETRQLKLVREDRLSANVLLCLFDGELRALDFHLEPESLHSELDSAGTNRWTRARRVRAPDGRLAKGEVVEVPLKSVGVAGGAVIAINTLAERLKAHTSADLAMQLIGDTPKVRFVIGV